MSEVRLIDANALTDEFEWCKQQAAECNRKEWDEIITRVSKQPTVDAVPVTRCEDCKWCEYPAHNSTKYGCKLFDRCVKWDWFCADGKRKEQSDG